VHVTQTDDLTVPTLREIALEAGTDKEGVHSYTEAYDRHLAALRHASIRLLELGVGGYADARAGGESLRMWKRYFLHGAIVGVDIYDKSSLAEDRITLVRGDQSDPAFLEDLGSRLGPFEVIIDDGSHVCAHVITSVKALFPHLAEGGIYVIEDLQTSYWQRNYGGSSDPRDPDTTMAFLKQLVDGLNHAEFDIPDYEPTSFDIGVTSLTFYHNLAFIQKGRNVEPSNFLPPHPRPTVVYDERPSVRPRRSRATGLRAWSRAHIPMRIRAALLVVGRPIASVAVALRRRTHSDDEEPDPRS
jgi:hypothetical protein